MGLVIILGGLKCKILRVFSNFSKINRRSNRGVPSSIASRTPLSLVSLSLSHFPTCYPLFLLLFLPCSVVSRSLAKCWPSEISSCRPAPPQKLSRHRRPRRKLLLIKFLPTETLNGCHFTIQPCPRPCYMPSESTEREEHFGGGLTS